VWQGCSSGSGAEMLMKRRYAHLGHRGELFHT
jgi:hypothetical protein